MSKKIKDWSPYKIYWDIFARLGFDRTINIKFGPAFEAKVNQHMKYLQDVDVKLGDVESEQNDKGVNSHADKSDT